MKIMVLTTPRSASNFYCHTLASERQLANIGEPFALTQSKIDRKRFVNAYTTFHGPNPALIKIHPGHISDYAPYRPKNWFQELQHTADEVHMLVRKNTWAQVRSLVVSTWMIEQGTGKFHDEWDETRYIPDNEHTRRMWRECEVYLKGQIAGLSALYQIMTTPITQFHWTEELPQQHKYIRPVEFEWEPEPIPFYDNIEKLFGNIK